MPSSDFGLRCLGWGLVLMLAAWSPAFSDDANLGPNLLPAGKMDYGKPTYVPWAGVDGNNNIHGIDGQQMGVNDSGAIGRSSYGPSIAVGDLRGTGLQDLVLADTAGFFWYFPNSGTPQKPVFTQGEVIPIWLGEERTNNAVEGADNPVPRIQLVDFDGNKRFDIVAGVYSGKLFHIHNDGSGSAPLFKPTYDRDHMLINTHRNGLLWNNYMAPYLTTQFSGSNLFSLVTGEGTYSANSIYLLQNTGSNYSPSYDEDHMQKIIPGMGLEHLTPAVIDWNNDGKADIITGDRTGYITLYLNSSSDPQNPTFDAGTHLKIGNTERFGAATTVTVADLTGNHLPNLLIGRADGTVLYALNTGKLGAPVFSTPATPLKGVLPPTYHYVSPDPSGWFKAQAYGAPDELISLVNPQTQPGFTFPQGETTKNALKFSVWPVKNVYFPVRYYPPVEDEYREHLITNRNQFTMKLNTDYRVHFWIKSEGSLNSLRYWVDPNPEQNNENYHPTRIINPVNVSNDWTEINDTVRFDNDVAPDIKDWHCNFQFRFTGQTTFYIDDLSIQEELK